MRLSSALLTALYGVSVSAIGQHPTINFNGSGSLLASSSSPVQIWADQDDWPAVLRVCDDLAVDFGRVTGTNGTVTTVHNGTAPALNSSMIYNVTGRSSYNIGSMPRGYGSHGGVIIAGTIGNSSLIDLFISQGKIDVSEIEGTWEAYTSAIVANPLPGVLQAMVIAGKCSMLQS